MQTRVSTKGQVVIPRAIREKLQLRPGDTLITLDEADRIVLIPAKKRVRRARIVRDPLTGLPVLAVDPNAPRLSSKQVAEILAEFP